MDEFNPYAAPEALPPALANSSPDDGTCWRDGDELLAVPHSNLPRYCVKCGQPAVEYRKRNFHWHSPWIYLLILLHFLVYLIVALAVRKQAVHHVGLCAAHRRRRQNFIIMAWSSLLPLFGCFLFDSGVAIGLGILGFVVMLFWGLIGMQILKPRKIDIKLAVYRGVSTTFLARLPRYPYRRD
jgi:hypothetical protein